MANHTAANDPAGKQLAKGAKAEHRLLQREREAEKAVLKARAKAGKAQAKLDRWTTVVADAEAKLRDRQAKRAAGPNGANGDVSNKPQVAALTAAAGEPTSGADAVIVLPGQPDGDLAGKDAELILPEPPARAPRRRARRSSGAGDSST